MTCIHPLPGAQSQNIDRPAAVVRAHGFGCNCFFNSASSVLNWPEIMPDQGVYKEGALNIMNAKAILPKLKAWFEDYIRQFSSEDPIVQKSMNLKAEHTRRVCDVIMDIGGTLDLSMDDLCMAKACGLLHDIGRFQQYIRYRTFSDYKSEDHAALGVEVIKANRVLNGLTPAIADIIVRVVRYHNRALLPVGEGNRCLFFLKLLRDADKVDIWRVLTDYYQNAGETRNPTIEMELPDIDQVSDPVYEALMNGKIAQVADLRTLNDFKLFQIGWIYDVNFPRTFQIVREKVYLELIRDALPQRSVRATEIYKRARAYLERNSSAGQRVCPETMNGYEKANKKSMS